MHLSQNQSKCLSTYFLASCFEGIGLILSLIRLCRFNSLCLHLGCSEGPYLIVSVSVGQLKTDESSVSGQLREVDSFFFKLAKSVTEIESEVSIDILLITLLHQYHFLCFFIFDLWCQFDQIKEALELEKAAMKQMIIKKIKNSSFPCKFITLCKPRNI